MNNEKRSKIIAAHESRGFIIAIGVVIMVFAGGLWAGKGELLLGAFIGFWIGIWSTSWTHKREERLQQSLKSL